MSGTDPMLGVKQQESPSVVVEGGPDPLIGGNLNGYVVKRVVAAGGMGLVYEAEHETIGRRAAVKVLKPEVASDAEWTKRFLTEARALAALKHRNLIEVLNFGKTPDGREYLMMEFLEGEPLDGYMRRMGALPPAVALGIADQVLNGLAEAHKKGVVHRDLKPSNVFLLREHNGELLVKILDFGLARQEPIALIDSAIGLPKRNDGASLLAGTPEYIAPEQARGLKVDGAADLYSLGIMLHEMLTGQLPFEATSVTQLLQKHLSERPPRLSSVVGNLPEGLEELVEALLEKDPLKRPASADAARVGVQRLLKRIASDSTAVRVMNPKHVPTMKIDRPTPQAAPPPTDVLPGRAQATTDQALEKAFPEQPRTGLFIAAALVLLLIGGGAAWWATRPEPVPPPQPQIAAPVPLPPPEPVAPKQEPVAVEEKQQPDPVEELAPIAPKPPPEVKKHAAAAPKTTAALPKESALVVVSQQTYAVCENVTEWKNQMRAWLTDLDGMLAKNDKLTPVWNDAKDAITPAYKNAATPADCARIQKAFDDFRRKANLPVD